MKLEPVTKLDKRSTKTSKNLTMASYEQILRSLTISRFMANLGQPESWFYGL